MDKILSLFPNGSGQFSETFDTFTKEWGKMLQYQTITRMRLPIVQAKYSERILELLDEMRPGNRFSNLLVDGEKFFIEGKNKEIAIAGAKEAVDQSLKVGDSMALLRGHTILENALQKFLEIILAISPASFYDKLNNQSVSIGQARDPQFESILTERATKHVIGIRKESILIKCDQLLNILGSEHNKYSSKIFKYNRVIIEEIDIRRHDVAHGRNLSLTGSQVDSDLDYLFQAFGYFVFLMHVKFDLKISGYPYISEALKKRDRCLAITPQV